MAGLEAFWGPRLHHCPTLNVLKRQEQNNLLAIRKSLTLFTFLQLDSSRTQATLKKYFNTSFDR